MGEESRVSFSHEPVLLDEVIDGVTKNTQEALTTRAREIYREMK